MADLAYREAYTMNRMEARLRLVTTYHETGNIRGTTHLQSPACPPGTSNPSEETCAVIPSVARATTVVSREVTAPMTKSSTDPTSYRPKALTIS